MPKGELKSEPSLAAENNSQLAPPRAARAAVAATLVEQAPFCETTKLSVAVSQAAPRWCSFRNTPSSRAHRECAFATAASPTRKLTEQTRPQPDERPECLSQHRHFKQSTPCLCLTTVASLTCMRADTLALSGECP